MGQVFLRHDARFIGIATGFDGAFDVLDNSAAAGNGANCTRLCEGVAELLSATLL